ncbi:MAG: hypothetical protein CAPSK01_004692 [Candidatus Accumulibacter vicinus]|uniref:Uncharacterized protein n=1 Tax=Candidatus Accumulibacter vicinus TaxID=2954382 RepID=A0A084XUE5_9PROT|nr:MAG: hypothetical protein CAPSK01_004692 [Candidatus Accumulibacter vicinus]
MIIILVKYLRLLRMILILTFLDRGPSFSHHLAEILTSRNAGK